MAAPGSADGDLNSFLTLQNQSIMENSGLAFRRGRLTARDAAQHQRAHFAKTTGLHFHFPPLSARVDWQTTVAFSSELHECAVVTITPFTHAHGTVQCFEENNDAETTDNTVTETHCKLVDMLKKSLNAERRKKLEVKQMMEKLKEWQATNLKVTLAWQHVKGNKAQTKDREKYDVRRTNITMPEREVHFQIDMNQEIKQKEIQEEEKSELTMKMQSEKNYTTIKHEKTDTTNNKLHNDLDTDYDNSDDEGTNTDTGENEDYLSAVFIPVNSHCLATVDQSTKDSNEQLHSITDSGTDVSGKTKILCNTVDHSVDVTAIHKIDDDILSHNTVMYGDTTTQPALMQDDSNALMKCDTQSQNAQMQDDSLHQNAMMQDDTPYQNAQMQDYTPIQNALIQNASNALMKCDTQSQNALMQGDTQSQVVLMEDNTESQNVLMQDETPSQNALVQDDSNALKQSDTRSQNALMQDDTPSQNSLMQDETPHLNALMHDDTLKQNALIPEDTPSQNALLQDNTQSQNMMMQNDTLNQNVMTPGVRQSYYTQQINTQSESFLAHPHCLLTHLVSKNVDVITQTPKDVQLNSVAQSVVEQVLKKSLDILQQEKSMIVIEDSISHEEIEKTQVNLPTATSTTSVIMENDDYAQSPLTDSTSEKTIVREKSWNFLIETDSLVLGIFDYDNVSSDNEFDSNSCDSSAIILPQATSHENLFTEVKYSADTTPEQHIELLNTSVSAEIKPNNHQDKRCKRCEGRAISRFYKHSKICPKRATCHKCLHIEKKHKLRALLTNHKSTCPKKKRNILDNLYDRMDCSQIKHLDKVTARINATTNAIESEQCKQVERALTPKTGEKAIGLKRSSFESIGSSNSRTKSGKLSRTQVGIQKSSHKEVALQKSKHRKTSFTKSKTGHINSKPPSQYNQKLSNPKFGLSKSSHMDPRLSNLQTPIKDRTYISNQSSGCTSTDDFSLSTPNQQHLQNNSMAHLKNAYHPATVNSISNSEVKNVATPTQNFVHQQIETHSNCNISQSKVSENNVNSTLYSIDGCSLVKYNDPFLVKQVLPVVCSDKAIVAKLMNIISGVTSTTTANGPRTDSRPLSTLAHLTDSETDFLFTDG